MPFNPWTDLSAVLGDNPRLEREMNRLFRHFAGDTRRATGEYPAVNVWDDTENVYLEAELPGLDQEALEIYVSGGNQLSIKGRRERPRVEEAAWHRQERGFGEFARVVTLPSDVESDRVEAEMKNGVLTLRLPKREEAKPRKIVVKTA